MDKMKITVRSFSLGLLTASIILFIMYFIIDDTSQAVDDLNVEELTAALEEKGYRAITEDEFISYSVYLDEQQKKENEVEKNNEEEKDEQETEKKPDENGEVEADAVKENEQEEEEEQEEAKTITLKVEQGYVSQDIGKILKDEGFIDDEVEFVQYMEDNGYSSYIQIGTFKLKSDMSLKEIAETLTTYPGN